MTPSSPGSDRLREPPIERFAVPQQAFDLRAEVQALKAEHPPITNGHRQKTLYKHGKATIALFLFNKNAGLTTHQAAGVVTIHAIDGRLRITSSPTSAATTGPASSSTTSTSASQPNTSSQSTHILTSSQILILAPSVPHAVLAEEESTMLLQVHLE